MITVCQENNCAGCMACLDVCPKDAITVIDSIKYYNAVIDEDKCIGCELCHSVCQDNQQPSFREPFEWYQGWAMDESIRASSSSGGFAAAIQRQFIIEGGIVCSCCFENGQFIFKAAHTVGELRAFKGSKYIKSNPIHIYKEIRELLKFGRKVLFTGLPCQVASLKNYIKKDDLLYTIDLVCHGTPSPRVFEQFLREKHKYLSDVKELSFRVKNTFNVSIDGKKLTVPRVRDYYSKCFLDGLCYTENCYRCKYARIERTSDLTIGDSWGSELPKETRDKGVSLALCLTEKGKELLHNSDIVLLDVNFEKALKANSQLQKPSTKTKNVDIVLDGVVRGIKLDRIMRRLYPKLYFKNEIKKILYYLGI